MWEALRVAQAEDFVRAMGGLEAPIEQGGTNVSGGQRQRLSIARALVRKPEIYVFDDSFSALDLATDARLRAALAPYTRDAAVVIVAQRVSTISTADQIVVLDDGDIVGIGTHDELLARAARPTPRSSSPRSARGGRHDRHRAGTRSCGRDRRRPDDERRRSRGRPAASACPPSAPRTSAAPCAGCGTCSRPSRPRLLLIVVMAIGSTVLNVLGPQVLGDATDVVDRRRDRGERHRLRRAAPRSCSRSALVYVGARLLGVVIAYILAGVVQRLMFRLRAQAEAKLNALPLSYIDRQPRGDLLSRVTNDLDNVAQSLQQTLSQMLTSVLLLVGVAVMMFTISPLAGAGRARPRCRCRSGHARRSARGPGPASSRSGAAPASSTPRSRRPSPATRS